MCFCIRGGYRLIGNFQLQQFLYHFFGVLVFLLQECQNFKKTVKPLPSYRVTESFIYIEKNVYIRADKYQDFSYTNLLQSVRQSQNIYISVKQLENLYMFQFASFFVSETL